MIMLWVMIMLQVVIILQIMIISQNLMCNMMAIWALNAWVMRGFANGWAIRVCNYM